MKTGLSIFFSKQTAFYPQLLSEKVEMVNLCIVCAFLGYYWETFIQWSPDAVVPDEKKM